MALQSSSLLWKASTRFIPLGLRCGTISQLNSGPANIKTITQPKLQINQIQKVSPCLVQLSQLSQSRSGMKPPKKPLSSYFLFKQDHYPTISRSNPDRSVTDISKEIGQMWRNLPHGEKEKYINAAQEETRKYKQMIDRLDEQQRQQITEYQSLRRKKTKTFKLKRKLKELERPKRPMNQYNLFARERSMQRDTTPPRVFFRQIAAEWRAMTDEQKQPYKLQAKTLSKKYAEEMLQWEERMRSEGHPEVIRGRRAPRKSKPAKRTPKKTKKKAAPKKKAATKKKTTTAKKTDKKTSTTKRKTKKKDEPEDPSWMREE